MWHMGSGRIVYDPYRGQMKNKTTWWCVVDVDKEITRYYRWWVWRKYGIELYQPSWDAHISVIRGEKPSTDKMNLWKKYHKQIVDFKYEHNVRWAGDKEGVYKHYWFVVIDCPFLIDIRKEFDLPHDWRLHLTIGRTYEHQTT